MSARTALVDLSLLSMFSEGIEDTLVVVSHRLTEYHDVKLQSRRQNTSPGALRYCHECSKYADFQDIMRIILVTVSA